jgi:hypothetical protein
MANSTPSRPGQQAGAGDALALLLELFGGEVQASYERATIMRPMQRMFALNNGKSLRFPRVGRATATYHTPGTEIVGQVIEHDEIVLTPDDKLISDVFIADVDEALNHYDVRSEYVRQLAEALAVKFDQNSMRAVIKAARTNDLLDGPAAAPITYATLTNVQGLFDKLSEAKQQLDESHVRVDREDLFGLLRPSEWYLLARSDKNLNKDFNGGDASIRKHTLETIDGIKIVKSNITPWADDRANTAIPARYRIATNTTWGAVFTKDAIATAEVMGVSVQSEEQIRKQGHLILARQMTGTDVFRASDAVELRTGAPAST